MAKKRARQGRIPGTGPDIPEAVLSKANEYADSLYTRRAEQAREDTLRAELIDLAGDHKWFGTIDVDDYEVTIEKQPAETKIKCKLKKDDDD